MRLAFRRSRVSYTHTNQPARREFCLVCWGAGHHRSHRNSQRTPSAKHEIGCRQNCPRIYFYSSYRASQAMRCEPPEEDRSDISDLNSKRAAFQTTVLVFQASEEFHNFLRL